MKVYFVMGLPHSGKSSYIHSNFDLSKYELVDILDSEIEEADEAKALLRCGLKLNIAIENGYRNNTDVILEFPGLSKKQRAFFLRQAKRLLTKNDEIIAVWISASDDDIARRIDLNGHDGDAILQEKKSIMEVPSTDEGFAEFVSHTSNGVPNKISYVLDQAKYHCGYDGLDIDEAMGRLEQYFIKGRKNDTQIS